MQILGIESTCDETAAAVVADGYDVRSNVVATQEALHAKYRGVVPEIASRAHIENILPVLREAIAGGRGDACVAPFGGSANARSDDADRADTVAATPASPEVFDNAACGTTCEAGLAPTGKAQGDACVAPTTQSRATQASPLPQIDAVAVAHRPGLIGSLLVGVTAAKTLAWALGKPLIGVDHVHAHLYSVMLEKNETPPMPAVGLVVSGGHTALYRVNSWLDVKLIGSTIDDAVGEAYDKVAAILGLGYPGGPVLDRLAEFGDPKAIRFPRTLLAPDSLDFSFSGLKTAVLYHVRGVPTKGGPSVRDPANIPPPPMGQTLHDIAASFQAACVEVILKKLRRAVQRTGAKSVIIGGGVSANRGLRAALQNFDVPVFVPPTRYCTDNAAMSAGLAHVYYEAGQFSDLSLDAITHSHFREG